MLQGELYIHVRWEEDEEEVPQSSKLYPKKRYKLKDYDAMYNAYGKTLKQNCFLSCVGGARKMCN